MSHDIRNDQQGGTGAEADFDPEVASLLQPLAESAVPDTWSRVAGSRRAGDRLGVDGDLVESDVVDAVAPQPHPRPGPRRSWRLAVAAGLVAVVTGGTLALRIDGGRQLDSVADQSIDATVDNDSAQPDENSGAPPQPFPDGVEIGPDRTTMSSLPPTGSFLVVYDAGGVVIGADGRVLGHYPGDVPGFLYPEPRTVTADGPPDPPGCERSAILGAGSRLYFCSDEVGPTVEFIDDVGERRPLASFPAPPDGVSSAASVPGRLTDGYIAPGIWRPRPLLLEWRQDVSGTSVGCGSIVAGLIVDSPFWSTATPRGGPIRHLDGSGWWDGTSPSDHHQIEPLGWAADGEAAYVWEYNRDCHEQVEIDDGIYAYQLDGSSRLVTPVHSDARDVVLITYPDPSEPAEADESIQPDALVPAQSHPELWRAWTGPLELGNIDPESLLTNENYGADAEMMIGFVRGELGMSEDASVSLSLGDPAAWIAVDGEVAVRFTPNRWFRDTEVQPGDLDDWTVVQADTFLPDGDASVSAMVAPDGSGTWSARITVPGHQAEVRSEYRIDDMSYEPTITDTGDGVEIVYELDAEPAEPAVLTVTWRRGNRLVAYHRSTIPPGQFAAG